jgi:Cu/Ag efflux protein CusF
LPEGIKMKAKQVSLGIVIIGVSGCAAYQSPPLRMTHPANAQAAAAPALPKSNTLAYSRADMLALSAAATPPGGHEGHHADTKSDGQRNIVGEGKVVATVPSANQLVVEHGEIKGFMDAMTMGYRVEPPSLLEGLRAGDQVRFTIDVPNKTITKIEKLK